MYFELACNSKRILTFRCLNTFTFQSTNSNKCKLTSEWLSIYWSVLQMQQSHQQTLTISLEVLCPICFFILLQIFPYLFHNAVRRWNNNEIPTISFLSLKRLCYIYIRFLTSCFISIKYTYVCASLCCCYTSA